MPQNLTGRVVPYKLRPLLYSVFDRTSRWEQTSPGTDCSGRWQEGIGYMAVIGIDIGGSKCAIVRTEELPVEGSPFPYDRLEFPTTDMAETLERIHGAIEKLGPGDDPLFGVSCGDPQNSLAGIILSPPNLPDWDRVPITDNLTGRFGGTAWLMNDANAGALAEWMFGAARGCRNVIFCTHGTGMGAGLILDGRLYEGETGSAGEIGHLRMAPDGPVGYGKEGSLEGFTSGGGIARMAQSAARDRGGRVDFNPTRDIDEITAREVGEAALRGDDLAIGILAESGRWLGRGLAILIDILNPEMIVLGSLYSRIGEFLRPTMEEELRKECLPRSLEACTIVPTELGEEIGDHAAITVALYRSQQMI